MTVIIKIIMMMMAAIMRIMAIITIDKYWTGVVKL